MATANLGKYRAAWQGLVELNRLSEIDRPTLQAYIENYYRPWRDAFRQLIKETRIAPPEGSLAQFFEGIGTSVGRAQSLMDRRSLEFSRARQKIGLAPAFFQIPKVQAQLRFAIEDSSEEDFGVFAHPDDPDENGEGQANEQTVVFEIAAVPPTPEEAAVPARTSCRLLADDERDAIIAAARDERYSATADHAILREQLKQGTLLILEVFTPGTYLLVRGDQTRYQNPTLNLYTHQIWFFRPAEHKLERLTERVSAGAQIFARSLKGLASRQRSVFLQRSGQKVDLSAFKDAFSDLQALAAHGGDAIDEAALRQFVPLYERMREELLYLARLLGISAGNDDAGELFSQVGRAALRAQDALDRNRSPGGGGFVIPRIQADFKFQVDSVGEEGVGVLFYNRKRASRTTHQQSVSFEVVPMGITPELQAELDREPDPAAERREQTRQLLPCRIVSGGGERERLRGILGGPTFDRSTGIEKLRDAIGFRRTVILELIRPDHFLLLHSGGPADFALWYLDRNGADPAAWRLDALPVDATADCFAAALDAFTKTRQA